MQLEPSAYGFTPKTMIGSDESLFRRAVFGASDFGGTQTELPNKMTVLTAAEAAAAISEGYRRVTGKKPTVQVLALLLGQWALETGNGKYVHNYNFANVKRYAGTPYFQYFRCSEIIDGQEVFFDPPAPECAFAAYLNAIDGAEAYVRILQKRPTWWAGLQSGNILTFNTALSTAPKYYTANPATYLKGLQDRVNTYLPQAKKYGATVMGAAASAFLVLGLAGGTYFLVRKYGLPK